MLIDLIGWPVYEVANAAAKLQKNVKIVKSIDAGKVQRYKFDKDELKNCIVLEIEDGKVSNLWLEQ